MKRTRLFLAPLAAAQFAAVLSHAQTETVTDPLGYVSFPIKAGAVNAPSTALISLPLQDENAFRSAVSSVVSGTELQISNVSWTANELADPSAPAFVRILSGAKAGALVAVSSNTGNALTVAADLSGIATGDRLEIVGAHTLGNLFGDTLLGGSNAKVADNIITVSGAIYSTYYYNTDRQRWELNTDPATAQDNVVIRPDTGFYIVRRGPGFNLVSAGRVPITDARIPVDNVGNSLITYGFPIDVTLGQLALQNAIPGWRSHASAASADWLSIDSAGTALSYYFTGTNWRRTSGAPTNRDSIVIKAGTPLALTRSGSTPGTTDYTKAKPY